MKNIIEYMEKNYQFAHMYVGDSKKEGDLTISYSQDEELDWKYYAKSYKFPKKTVSNRQITIRGTKKIYLKKDVDSFRGHFLKKACLEAGFEFYKVTKKVDEKVKFVDERIRINSKISFSLQQFLQSEGIKIHISQTNLSGPEFFLNEALEDLKKQIQAKNQKNQKVWDFQKLRDLGFCRFGIRVCAKSLNLNPNDSYKTNEIKKAFSVVDKNEKKRLLIKYKAQLKKIGVI